MLREKNWRKHQTKRVQNKRKKIWNKRIPNLCLGVLRKNNFSCGCSMCKPYKNGWEKGLYIYKVSERKKL